ncbi:MAG TPA: TolC family protein, partial [Aggregicoccus sp.]|nr:TolC family protein [Aggregicoccus sp.]
MLTKTLVIAALLAQAPAAPQPPADAPVATPAEPPAPNLTRVPGVGSDLPLLTFEEALVQAEKQNPDLEAARARLRQAQTLGAQAWSGYLPQVSAQGGYTRNSTGAELTLPTRYGVRDTGAPQGPVDDPENPGSTRTNLIAVPIESLTFPISKENQFVGQLSASQGIFVPELFPAIKNAYLAEKATELTVENARRELLFGVARAYLGAASLRESISVQEQLLEVRRGFEKDAQARFSVGDVAKIAVLRATLDRTRAEQDLVRSRNAYQSAKSSLAALLARPVDF